MKSYTVSVHARFVDSKWDEAGRVIACKRETMPDRTFGTLKQANKYIRECKAKGFHGVRIANRTGLGTWF